VNEHVIKATFAEIAKEVVGLDASNNDDDDADTLFFQWCFEKVSATVHA
jgi:hypothetical protein